MMVDTTLISFIDIAVYILLGLPLYHRKKWRTLIVVLLGGCIIRTTLYLSAEEFTPLNVLYKNVLSTILIIVCTLGHYHFLKHFGIHDILSAKCMTPESDDKETK